MIQGKKRPPAFQFYCRDWLGSSTVPSMSDREFRAYVNLLAHAWLGDPVGSLPDDDKILAALSGIPKKAWPSVSKKVKSCFEKRGQLLTNLKLERQFQELDERGHQFSERGKKGASKRWEMPDNQVSGDAYAMSQALLKNGTASASASAPAQHPPTPQGGMLDLAGNDEQPTRLLTRTSPGARRGPDGWYVSGNIVECDKCGKLPRYEHLKCHYCFKIYTPGETDDNHRCKRP